MTTGPGVIYDDEHDLRSRKQPFRPFYPPSAPSTIMTLIISVSGMRGIVGETFTPDVAARFAIAFESTLPRGPLVLGHDGRTTGPSFARHLSDALALAGRRVIYAGPCATPTMGVLVSHMQAAGGIQVSASHNPAEYNGIKLFGGDGRVLSEAIGAEVRRLFFKAVESSPSQRPGVAELLHDTSSQHWNLIQPLVDVQRIRRCRFKVFLDSNHGAGGVVGRRVLDELDCHVTCQGGEADGNFEHLPEPTRENLLAACDEVRKLEAAVGFCQDPDADRLALIDERGRYVGEEYTLALCVDHVLRSQAGAVVTNCSTSRMTADLAEKYGVPIYRSAVGEANVVDLMIKHRAVIGGEGNGGVIHPQVVMVRDSMVAMALVLDAMSSRRLPLSELVDELPRYAMHKSKITLSPDRIPDVLEELQQYFSDARPDRLDGLRLDWPDRWLLVRASNTEPIVRVFAEAPSDAEAARLCSDVEKVILSLG
jgi:phosphomannomutase